MCSFNKEKKDRDKKSKHVTKKNLLEFPYAIILFLDIENFSKKLFLENIPPFPDFSKIPLIEKIIHTYIRVYDFSNFPGI